MSINCSVKSRVTALSNIWLDPFFQNNYPQNIINWFSDKEVKRQEVCNWTSLRRMTWKRKKIKTLLRAVTIKQLSFGGKCKEGRNVFHICSARKKRGTCYWAAFSSVWSFYPGKSNHIFESENFRFPSSTKVSITWGVKCQKLRFGKS